MKKQTFSSEIRELIATFDYEQTFDIDIFADLYKKYGIDRRSASAYISQLAQKNLLEKIGMRKGPSGQKRALYRRGKESEFISNQEKISNMESAAKALQRVLDRISRGRTNVKLTSCAAAESEAKK